MRRAQKKAKKKLRETIHPKAYMFVEQDTFFVTRHGIILNYKNIAIETAEL